MTCVGVGVVLVCGIVFNDICWPYFKEVDRKKYNF